MQYLHTMIRVSNLEESLHFFCDLLGMVEISRKSSETGRFTLVFLAAPEDEVRAREEKAKFRKNAYVFYTVLFKIVVFSYKYHDFS